MTARVLIVEDHPLVGEATASLVACELGGFFPVLSSNAELTIQLIDQEPESWFLADDNYLDRSTTTILTG